MGRPRMLETDRPVPTQVRLPPQVADAVYRAARHSDTSGYAFLGALIVRVFAQQETLTLTSLCYSHRHSTLSLLLGAAPSSGESD